MTSTRKLLTFGIVGLAGALAAGAALRPARLAGAAQTLRAPRPPQAARKIQVAILLDTSGSMDGLIDQAKSQLWRIVNELAAARRQGNAARVEIALYEYGKQTVPAADGYVRRILPFTDDLDRVSEALFALATNGGEEYCGRAIHEATQGLEWSAGKDDLKLVFIAGNEAFTQGEYDYHKAIGEAKEKGIVVNVIHCGEGEEEGWRDAAALAGGEYMMIDHNARVAAIDAPQDAEIARLGTEINGTYLRYGADGDAAAARQEAQDQNAYSAQQGAVAQRAMSKASGTYRNASWDLVDGVRDGVVDLTKIDSLPENMKKMTLDERKAYVAVADAHRKEIQARIQTLSVERQKFVDAKMRESAAAGAETLDRAVVNAVHTQAEKLGYTFAKR